MFGKRKQPAIPFDRGRCVPVIRSSIRTGKQTAGFKNLVSSRFQEYILIRNDRDLQEFLDRYQAIGSEFKRER